MGENYLIDSNTLIYASQEPEEAVAGFLEICSPYVCDISFRECLIDWPFASRNDFAEQRTWLEKFFDKTKRNGKFLSSDDPILERRIIELEELGVQPDDARLAVVAEHYELTLVTADNRKNFIPRLEKLNQANSGKFHFLQYAYFQRNQFFAALINQ